MGERTDITARRPVQSLLPAAACGGSRLGTVHGCPTAEPVQTRSILEGFEMATQAEIRQENDPQPHKVNDKIYDLLWLLETVFGPLTANSKRKQFLADLRSEYTGPAGWLRIHRSTRLSW